jgi:hypothetical protein
MALFCWSDYPGPSPSFGRKQIQNGNPQDSGDAKQMSVSDRCLAEFPARHDVATDILPGGAKFSSELLLCPSPQLAHELDAFSNNVA